MIKLVDNDNDVIIFYMKFYYDKINRLKNLINISSI